MKFRLLNLVFSAAIFAAIIHAPDNSVAQTTGVVNSSANQAQSQNDKVGSRNIMMGEGLIAIGSAMPFCTGCYLIYMGITAIKQGETQKQRAQDARRTAFDSSYSAANFSSYVNQDAANAIASATKYLEGQGYKFDPKKMSVTNPDGKVFNLQDLSRNASDMAKKTGFPQEDIEKALAAMDGKAKEVSKDIKVAQVAIPTTATSEGAGITGFNFSKSHATRKPASLEMAGLKKYLGNDQIGVAGDDIFLMVQRRYQEKNKIEFFSK